MDDPASLDRKRQEDIEDEEGRGGDGEGGQLPVGAN
jgi:hypothetical protein